MIVTQGEKVTFVIASGEFMCGYVRWVNERNELSLQDNVTGTLHTHHFADEGITWVRGHHTDLDEVKAMLAAGLL